MSQIADFSLDLDFADTYPMLAALRSKMPFMVSRYEKAWKRSKVFADKHMRPIASEVDRRIQEDHSYLPMDFCRVAAREKMFSLVIPKVIGGQGGDLLELCIIFEELCAACPGLGNIIGAHYLGLSALFAGLKMSVTVPICEEIVEGEKRGEPVMLSAAITEPGAGSDVEDEHAVKTARICTFAEKVNGGYKINGQKIFISNGHLAKYHAVVLWRDRNNLFESGAGFIIPTGTKGFDIVKAEIKMGQLACPASVLVFEDCFIPEDKSIMPMDMKGTTFSRVGFVLGASRAGVGAIGTGIARGAFERALEFAATHTWRGERIIDQQWAQMILVDMLRNVWIGRAFYVESAMTDQIDGLMSVLKSPLLRFAQLYPAKIRNMKFFKKIVSSSLSTWFMNRGLEKIARRRRQRVQAYSSAAKYTGTDLAMENANLAIELAGAAGCSDPGIEKTFRDAKLVQIYEGTNQINRIHVWDNIIQRNTIC